MIRTSYLFLVFTACGGDAADAPIVDAPLGTADAPRTDAPIDRPDAPPNETCSTGGWCLVPNGPAAARGLAVTADNEAWIVGDGARVHTASGWTFHDLTWPDVQFPSTLLDDLFTVHVAAANDVWVGGDQGYIARYSGLAWSAPPRPLLEDVAGIWGAAPDDVWLVYRYGSRRHWNGVQLVAQPKGTNDYNGIWGRAANDLWAFGDTSDGGVGNPVIEHWNGTAWEQSLLPGAGFVLGVWGTGASDLYAVVSPNDGTTKLHHYNGTAWSAPIVPIANMTVLAVWGRTANDVWAVGKDGKIAHWDGSTWTASASGTNLTLSKITGTAQMIWAAGPGIALRRSI